MSRYINPWWVDPSSSSASANRNMAHEDAYSIDSSMYIEQDDDYRSQDSDDDDDDRSDVNVILDVPSPPPPPRRVTATQSSVFPPPRLDPPQSFGAPVASHTTTMDFDPSRENTNTTTSTLTSKNLSPTRKKLQNISSIAKGTLCKGTAQISKGTAQISKTLSNQWKNLTTPERPKNHHQQQSAPSSMEEPEPVVPDAVAFTNCHEDVVKTSSPRTSFTESVSKHLSNFGKKAMNFRSEHQRTQSTLTESSNTVQRESTSRSGRSTSTGSNSSSNHSNFRRYTVKELIHSLGKPDVDLPPALERRVRDFKFAQVKRRERHGDNKPWGIFGLYAHLSDIRADLEWAEDAAWRRQRSEPYLSWSDFEKSRDKGLRNRPWFTYGVIALCTIMVLVTLGVNDWSIEALNVNPLIGPSSETLIKVGARQTNLIVNEGQWYRLFTPLVLHAGLVHYVINMAAMYFIGGAVEQSHGFASAAVLFILPAVGGNILSAICLPQYISVGASGGIFGLIGGCLADISINWNLLFLKSTTDQESRWRHFMVLFWLAFDIIVNCIIGFTPFVDNFTHLGGFLYGLCCGLSTIERLAVGFFGLQSDKYSKAFSTFMKFFGLIASVISIMVTTVILVQSDGVTSPCHGCRYISCVPFPPRADEKWWYCDDCDFVTADLFVDGNGSGLYREIDLTCPNGEMEVLDIADDALYEKEAVRRALPTYCRDHCQEVFMGAK